VPPEFRPSERSKKKQEPLEPKQPRTVKDIVDDIMRDYRDRQRELGNVDNWGQPKEKLDKRKVEKWVRDNLPKLGGDEGQTSKRGKKRFMPSAPEGLSEAIGSKLKGRSDGQTDSEKKSNVPKIGRPEGSTHKEKKLPTPKSPSKGESSSKVKIPPLKDRTTGKSDSSKRPAPTDSRESKPAIRDPKSLKNKESKELLGPKLKTKPLEIQAKKVESLKTPSESFSEAIGNKFKQEKEAKSFQEKKRTMENPIKDTKIGTIHEVKVYSPEVRGMQIQSEVELRKFVNEELPGMKHMPNFDKIMNDAIAQINLRKLIGQRNTLSFPEIRELSNQIDVPLRTTRNWTTEFGKPKFYKLAESAITKSEAKIILDRLKASRNGVDSVKELESLLATLYIYDHVKQLKSYNRDMETSRKYLKFLDNLSEGGIVTDIAKRTGVSPLTGRNYTNGQFPHLVKRAADIPSNMPENGWKWIHLPNENRSLKVPEKVKDWSHIVKVLDQLIISKDRLNELSSKYGIHDKETAFMYALGGIISDGSLTSKGPSSRMTLPLSKKYSWSPLFGNAVSLSLETLGIHAERKSDWKSPDNVIMDRGKERTITGPGFRVWGSEKHPLLKWVRKSCLGLKSDQTKVENSIDAEWVLSIPRRARRALTQGIADGDGYVSVNSQYAALSTKVNQSLFRKLLRSFNIESSETKKDVRILKTDSILRFAEIEPFKQAISRKNDLEELKNLIKDRKAKDVDSHISKREIDYALDLRSKGKSFGEITKLLYRDFGISWDISTIEHAIKRFQKSKSSI